MSSQITTELRELTALQETRYRVSAERTQSPVYVELAERAAFLRNVLAAPSPAEVAREQSWRTENTAVAELLEDVATILEGAA